MDVPGSSGLLRDDLVKDGYRPIDLVESSRAGRRHSVDTRDEDVLDALSFLEGQGKLASVSLSLRAHVIGAHFGDLGLECRQERVEQVKQDDGVDTVGDKALDVTDMVAERTHPDLGSGTKQDRLFSQVGAQQVDRDVSGETKGCQAVRGHGPLEFRDEVGHLAEAQALLLQRGEHRTGTLAHRVN